MDFLIMIAFTLGFIAAGLLFCTGLGVVSIYLSRKGE